MDGTPTGWGPRPEGGQRFPALVWALLHVPLFLAFYAASIAASVASTPAPYRLALWPTFAVQAVFLATLGWAAALPLSRWPGVYRRAAPLAMGVGTAFVALDARVYSDVAFHLNGFFFRVLVQPNALKETGVATGDVALFVGLATAFVALDVVLGGWFLRRFARPRRTWTWALALLLLAAAERTYGATLTFFGGPAIFAASTVLPLQVPVRMHGIVAKITGKREKEHLAPADVRLPAGLAPRDVRFTRDEDVLFVVAESLPAEHLDERTMPNLWRRATEGGAIFTRHHASSSATNYAIFSLMYGLQAQKLEAIVGAGRHPLLFGAMRENGYQLRLLAASCVDWMDLKETVFGGVQQDLRTWCDDSVPWPERDTAMLADATEFVRRADPARPVFVFLFFNWTHFNYHHPPQDTVFTPEWDGTGGVKSTATPGPWIRNRARNSAHYLDRELEAFLRSFEARRGRKPLLVFTGDHGEEFREKGHLAHGSDVTREQVNVPLAVVGPDVPRGRFDVVTSHVDVVPTILSLLGDVHPPSLHSDGVSVFEAPRDRFVLTTVGWEPRYAAVGDDMKVTVYAGLAGASVTDLDDRPLPDGDARLAANAGRILRALRGEDCVSRTPARPAAAAVAPPAQARETP
jgi:membrane-anchored protein YejM (alkaline phosphatase superfamily)